MLCTISEFCLIYGLRRFGLACVVLKGLVFGVAVLHRLLVFLFVGWLCFGLLCVSELCCLGFYLLCFIVDCWAVVC